MKRPKIFIFNKPASGTPALITDPGQLIVGNSDGTPTVLEPGEVGQKLIVGPGVFPSFQPQLQWVDDEDEGFTSLPYVYDNITTENVDEVGVTTAGLVEAPVPPSQEYLCFGNYELTFSGATTAAQVLTIQLSTADAGVPITVLLPALTTFSNTLVFALPMTTLFHETESVVTMQSTLASALSAGTLAVNLNIYLVPSVNNSP